MSDPYEDHELRDEWNEFKYYTDGVTTARMNQIEVNGELYPCVKVFMAESATESDVENVYEKAESLELVRKRAEFEEEKEHIFVKSSEFE